MNNVNRKYGLIRQVSDSRDFSFKKLKGIMNIQDTALPVSANNRFWCSAMDDQGLLGSCTGAALASLLEYEGNTHGLGGKNYKDLSKLFIYYNERVLEGTVDEDSGATLRSGAKTLTKLGVCDENNWKYKIENFRVKPSEQNYTDALRRSIHSYYSLTTLNDMKTCLADGRCFVFGFMVYSSFILEVANTGILNLPEQNESLLGGHAVMAVGYDDNASRFIIKNSWGKNWGLKGRYAGYFTMPYDYITNPDLAFDFWSVLKI